MYTCPSRAEPSTGIPPEIICFVISWVQFNCHRMHCPGRICVVVCFIPKTLKWERTIKESRSSIVLLERSIKTPYEPIDWLFVLSALTGMFSWECALPRLLHLRIIVAEQNAFGKIPVWLSHFGNNFILIAVQVEPPKKHFVYLHLGGYLIHSKPLW